MVDFSGFWIRLSAALFASEKLKSWRSKRRGAASVSEKKQLVSVAVCPFKGSYDEKLSMAAQLVWHVKQRHRALLVGWYLTSIISRREFIPLVFGYGLKTNKQTKPPTGLILQPSLWQNAPRLPIPS